MLNHVFRVTGFGFRVQGSRMRIENTVFEGLQCFPRFTEGCCQPFMGLVGLRV